MVNVKIGTGIVFIGILFILSVSGCLTGFLVQKAVPYCEDPDVGSVHICADRSLKVVYSDPGRGFDIVTPEGEIIECNRVSPGYTDERCSQATGPGFCHEESACRGKECVLSMCDCSCHEMGEEPEGECQSDCGRINGAAGCVYDEDEKECVLTYTEESVSRLAEESLKKSRKYQGYEPADLTLAGVREADCENCWEFEYRFISRSEESYNHVYSVIVPVTGGDVGFITFQLETIGCDTTRDCWEYEFECTDMYSNAKCKLGECVCERCCNDDSHCLELGDYVCRERECHPRIAPGNIPPREADCLDRYGEYENNECTLPGGEICTDGQYLSEEGCWKNQLDG